MATITKPIALNESFNTTESTPRNLADVLAQALQMLNTTISGLNFINATVVEELPTVGISTTTIYLVPSDDPQSENVYDEYINLDGTSAGWEKIGSTEIDLSNYYTKTETDTLLGGKVDKVNGKGLSTNDYTDTEKTKLAGIEEGAEVNPTSSVKTATDTFATVNGGLLEKCVIDLAPVQNLHGFDHPWVGEAGKNKWIPYTDATYSANNTTFTQNDDGTVDVVTGSGGASATTLWVEVRTLKAGTYILSGGINNNCFVGIQGNDFVYVAQSYGDDSSAFTIPTDASYRFVCRVGNGASVNGTFKPMIRLATESDPTFEPYENICPIIGHTEIDLYNVGKNLFENSLFNTDVGETLTYIHFAVPNGNYVMSTPDFPIVNGIVNAFFLAGKVTGGASSSYNGVYKDRPISITVTDGYYTVIYRSRNSTNTNNPKNFNWQIEEGSSATAYEPYLGHLYQIPIGSTVYGGTDEVVGGSGEVEEVEIIYDGSADENWQVNGTYPNTYYISIPTGMNSNRDLKCDRYKKVNSVESVDTGIAFGSMMNIRDNYNGATLADWKTYLSNNPLQIVYKLATPTTLSTSPTRIEALPSENNLSTPLDGQSIDFVEYRELFTWDEVEGIFTAGNGIDISEEKVISTDDDHIRDITREDYLNLKTLRNADIDENGVATFEVLESNKVNSLKVELLPNQPLHGYDKPWAGGAGKNKLPMTLSDIKSNNNTVTGIATWNDNIYTIYGISYTIIADDNGIVTKIIANGTADPNLNAILQLSSTLTLRGNYILNGCPNGGGASEYECCLVNTSLDQFLCRDFGSGVSISLDQDSVPRVVVRKGVTVTNLEFYPMLRLSTESDATFAPYANICPIYPYSGVEVTHTGEDSQSKTYTYNFSQSYFGAIVTLYKEKSVLSYWTEIASYNGETLPNDWYSSMDEYVEGTTPTIGSQVVYRDTFPAFEEATGIINIDAFVGENTMTPTEGKIIECVYSKIKSDKDYLAWECNEGTGTYTFKAKVDSSGNVEYYWQ